MRQRIVAAVGFLGVFAATVAGQQSATPGTKPVPQPSRPANRTVPRTADGHPDLQGMYDVATMTPVERPNGVKNLVLTKEEAAALEIYEQQRQVKNDAPLDPNRAAPPVGGETSTAQVVPRGARASSVAARSAATTTSGSAGGTQMITVDGQKRSSLIVDPPDGQMPPMKPEARRRQRRRSSRAPSHPDASEASAAAGPPGAFDGPEASSARRAVPARIRIRRQVRRRCRITSTTT